MPGNNRLEEKRQGDPVVMDATDCRAEKIGGKKPGRRGGCREEKRLLGQLLNIEQTDLAFFQVLPGNLAMDPDRFPGQSFFSVTRRRAGKM